MFALDAERAHELGIATLRSGLALPFIGETEPNRSLAVERFGLQFPSPLGIAAGFDKNAAVVNQLADLGFGFVEVGTVTLEPQLGNAKPRMFRVPQDRALINRLGFNNKGAVAIAERLKKLSRRCIVGVNIGKNKDVPNEEATENYCRTFDLIHSGADYVAINISSPNTPNLRELQNAESLDALLGALQDRKARLAPGLPLLVKIAPDMDEADVERIVDTCLRLRLDGIIATNSTTSRSGISTNTDGIGAGGLSGKPLAARSTEIIRTIYRASNGKLPIIGVGGIFTAEDAFEKITAGASLVQAYTGFVYAGPTFAREINAGFARILDERGYECIDDVVGMSANV